MLKKFGLVAVSVTASLAAVTPIAAAHEHGHSACSSTTDANGNVGQVNMCNVYGQHNGQHNGEGNTVNGVEIPAVP